VKVISELGSPLREASLLFRGQPPTNYAFY